MDPKRWIDDVDAPAGVRDALRGARRARPLQAETRARLAARVARTAAVPISVAALLSVKSAAAVGLGVGLLTASVSVAIFEYAEQPAPEEPTSAPKERISLPHPRGSNDQGLAVAPAPEAVEPVESAAPAALPAPAPRASSSGGLAEESQLLESARRSLDTSPTEALARVREHVARFPRGKLASERNLLELEALYRLGRRAEARALAERLLARGGDDLYTARIRRLLSKIDQQR